MVNRTLPISVIVPAYNGEDVLGACLEAVNASTCAPLETIVVDDGSTDRTPEIAAAHGATVLQSNYRQSGPGAARNVAAAKAAGEVLMFVDADVVVRPDTLELVYRHFANDASVAAVFGSYDTDPAAPNFLSQWKNLQHHFVHQQGNPDAGTFWAGCGAVRKTMFLEVGGFDVSKYARPSIEDIELGIRMRERGARIRLDPSIQVKHLKRWTFWQLLHTEIFCRAIPWSTLLVSRGHAPMDLNIALNDRFGAALVWVILLLLPLSFSHTWAISSIALSAILFLCMNRQFYGFLLRHRGLWFLARALPVHMLYYLYSSSCFALCWLRHQFARSTPTETAS